MPGKVYFIGAGPGDPELLTLKGKRLIEEADVIVYTDSLVDSRICEFAQPGAEVHGSARMSLDEIIEVMARAASQGKIVARVHTGDPAIYGAIAEQMAALGGRGISYEVVPGVSSLFAAAAALPAELTLPEVSQTVIITRREGRTPVPGKEGLRELASHQATMALFLSAGVLADAVQELREGGYPDDTPVAVVYRASWPDQRVVLGTLSDIAGKAEDIRQQAIILVGEALDPKRHPEQASRLYHRAFSHRCRQAPEPPEHL